MNIKDLKAAGEFAQSGIYQIINTTNGKIYVGSAVHIENRFKNHRKKLKYNKHPNKHLQAAYNQVGLSGFIFGLLEHCFKEQLLERERHWINVTNCCNPAFGYNKRSIPNSNLGLKFSEATRDKMKAARVGKTPGKGRKLSDAEKLKISLRMKGKKHSPEHIEKRIAYKRKPDRWPHGYICKCKPCMKLKSQAIRAKQIANASIGIL